MGKTKCLILGGLITFLLNPALATNAKSFTSIDKLISDDWYGIYFDGKKVGFQNLSFKSLELDGNKVFEFRLDQRIVFFYDHKKHPAQATISSVFSASEPWERIAGNYRSQNPIGEVKTVSEKLSGDDYIVSVSFQGKEEDKHVNKSKTTIMDTLSIENDCIQGVNAGQKGQYKSWNSEKQKDENYYYEFTKIEENRSQARDTKFVHVCISNPGGDTTDALYEIGTGKLIEMTFENGLVMKLESKEEATEDSKIHCFIINDYIEIDKPLEASDVEDIKSCTLLLPNIKIKDVPENSRTTTKAVTEGVEVKIIRETFDINEKVVELEIPDDIKEFLKESEDIQSEHEEIVNTAKMIVGIKKKPVTKAILINGWVYSKIQYETINNSDALTTLREKKGDCNEKAVLAIALARAAGIPAKKVSGIAYPGGSDRKFILHAWVKYYINGRWVEMDPATNEIAVDGTHLELSSHTMTKLMNRMIRVLDISKE
jgi:hypothetical protein